jgi:hypothetical protein
MDYNRGRDAEDQERPEQRLWRAVITTTVQDWMEGPLRQKREAEEFLFSDVKDYRTVCFSAGIDPTTLRERLQRIRSSERLPVPGSHSRN